MDIYFISLIFLDAIASLVSPINYHCLSVLVSDRLSQDNLKQLEANWMVNHEKGTLGDI